MRLAINLLLFISGYASILGLYFTVIPPTADRPNWHWALIAVSSVIYFALIYIEARRVSRESHKSFKSDKGINKYMCNWLSKSGRALILSRDLSWGEEIGSKAALLKKASNDDLIIYLHHRTPLSDELETAGAQIHLYGGSGFEPRSRFTILGFGKSGSRVAVGTQRAGKHIVYEFDAGEHPISALCEDLADAIARIE